MKNIDLKNMKISNKLKLGYGVILALLLIGGTASAFGITILNSSIKSLVNEAEVASEAIKDCRIETNIAARNVREMALNTDESSYAGYKQNVEENLTDAGAQLTALRETGIVGDEMYQAYLDTFTAWANDAYTIVEDIESGKQEEATQMIFDNCIPALDSLVTLAKEIDIEIDNVVETYIQRCRTIYIACIILIVVMSLSSIGISVFIGSNILKSITSPLKEIDNCARELTEGNLHAKLDYDSGDELGNLADSIRTAIEILSSYVDDISMTMSEFAKGNFIVKPTVEWRGDFVGILDAFNMFEKNMADTINGIQKVATQVETGAEQVSATSMELAQGATDQASVMEEFTATIETVSEQVSSNAKYAKNISKRVEEVGGEITVTTDKMNDMVDSMNEIEKSSQQIRKIIDTINDVATQTNLLALNASIEAARAGESGRGFAVVANQVTALAAQTAAAAKESTELIENSIVEVSRGKRITEEIAKQQVSVAQNTKNIVDEVNNVAETLGAQKDAFVQLNEGVNQINDVVQTNSATSQQCAASSQEMNCQADSLGKLISKFKVASM